MKTLLTTCLQIAGCSVWISCWLVCVTVHHPRSCRQSTIITDLIVMLSYLSNSWAFCTF